MTTADSEYEDNTYGWLYQLAKSFAMTGNLSRVLAQRQRIPLARQSPLPSSDSSQFLSTGSNLPLVFWCSKGAC